MMGAPESGNGVVARSPVSRSNFFTDERPPSIAERFHVDNTPPDWAPPLPREDPAHPTERHHEAFIELLLRAPLEGAGNYSWSGRESEWT
jgi:hypothetical protein